MLKEQKKSWKNSDTERKKGFKLMHNPANKQNKNCNWALAISKDIHNRNNKKCIMLSRHITCSSATTTAACPVLCLSSFFQVLKIRVSKCSQATAQNTLGSITAAQWERCVATTNQIVIKNLETLRDSELRRKLMNASDSNLGFLKAFFMGFRVSGF